MALAQWSETSILKQLRDCLKGGDGRCQPGPAMVQALASIATSVGQDISRNSWIGPSIALLSESLEVDEVDKILADRPGRNQTEWAKWKLVYVAYTWGRTSSKDGQDKIRELVYNLLMDDLKMLYMGYTNDDGSEIRGMDPKAICAKVKTDIGFVLKTTYLRGKLIEWGVPLRNQSGHAFIRGRSKTESVGSPSTIGPSTPSSLANTMSSTLPPFTASVSNEKLTTTALIMSKPQISFPNSSAPKRAASSGYNTQSKPVPWTRPSHIEHSENLNEQDEAPTINNLAPTMPENDPFFNNLADSMRLGIFATDVSREVSEFTSFAPGQRKILPSDLSMKDLPEIPITLNMADAAPADPKLDGTYPRSPPKLKTSGPILDSAHSSISPRVIGSNLSHSNDIFIQLVEKVRVLAERLDAEQAARIRLETKVVESYAHIGQCTTAYVALGRDYQELSLDFLNVSQRVERLENLYSTLQSEKDNEREARDALESQYHTLNDHLKKLQITNEDLLSRTNNMELENKLAAFTTTNLETTLNDLCTNFETLCSPSWTMRAELDTVKSKQDTLGTEFGNIKDRNAGTEEKIIKFENKHNTLQDNLLSARQQTIDLEMRIQALEGKTTSIEEKNGKLHCSVQALCDQNHILQRTLTAIQRRESALHEQVSSLKIEHTDFKTKIKKAEDRFSNSSLDSGLGRSPRNSIEGLPELESMSMVKRQWSGTSSTSQIEKKRARTHHGTEPSTYLAGQGEGDESPVLGPYIVSFRNETHVFERDAESNSRSSSLEEEMLHDGDEPFMI